MSFDTDPDVDRTVINQPASDATQVVSQPQANATQMAVTVECPVCHTANSSTETYCSDCGFLLGSAPVDENMPEVEEPSARLVAPDGREFYLNSGLNTVGRVDSDVLLTDPAVSRKHAEIEFRDGGWWLTDVGSTNGTFTDGTQLKANDPVQLEDGTDIKFGTSVVTFHAVEGAPSESAAAVEETEAVTVQIPAEQAAEEEPAEEEPMETVTETEAEAEEAPELAEEAEEVEVVPPDVEQGSEVEPVEAEAEPVAPEVVEPETPAVVGGLVDIMNPSANYQILSGVNTIGRSPDNTIQIIGDPYVSGHHAKIEYDDENFTVTDVGSTNGTLLNAAAIPKQEPQDLKPGDELTIGQRRYRLQV